MIYIERDLHRQIAELFHYALLPEAYLLLGTSESTDTAELFRIENKSSGIIVGAACRRSSRAYRCCCCACTIGRRGGARTAIQRTERPRTACCISATVELHGPASVLVSPDDNIVHFSAHAGRYLVHPGGTPTTSALKLVREELRMELQAALHSVRTHKKSLRTRPISVRLNGDSAPVVLDLRRALEPAQEGFLLLIFDECPTVLPTLTTNGTGAATSGEPDASRTQDLATFRELEAEKQLAEQRLQAIVQEYETSQEEIRASNEELQCADEELRSTLEELETSKEELQSRTRSFRR